MIFSIPTWKLLRVGFRMVFYVRFSFLKVLELMVHAASPISRTHTRNPFLRQASDYPHVAVSPLSPAAIPLPSPSPEEML